MPELSARKMPAIPYGDGGSVVPRLPPEDALSPDVTALLKDLEQDPGFVGDVSVSDGERALHATDNSIYEVLPQGVVYPRTEGCIQCVLRLLALPRYRQVVLTAKGGGTSTNGQCLGPGIICDVSRYMTRVLEIDPQSMTVRVESGVVLGHLNEVLAEQGYMFAPTTSTSSRVTVGGMIGTDASGIGSRIYGKTSDHIESIHLVMLGGEVWKAARWHEDDATPFPAQDRGDRPEEGTRVQAAVKRLCDITREHGAEIARVFPNIPRYFSGYNLLHLHPEEKVWEFPKVIAGSEGTLGVVSECVLRMVKKPTHSAMVVCVFSDWESCVEAGTWILSLDLCTAMEGLDEHIMAAAMTDPDWQGSRLARALRDHLPSQHGQNEKYKKTVATQLLLLDGHSAEDLESKLQKLTLALQHQAPEVVSKHMVLHFECRSQAEIDYAWSIRKKAVGLFAYASSRCGHHHHHGDGSSSSSDSSLRSCAFVEDVAVHPQDLPRFMRDFRRILEEHGLEYGMYGHLDAGCMHVRPKLDVGDGRLVQKIKSISDAIYQLSCDYGGVLWGEHGKGYRSEYVQDFLGPVLWQAFCAVKTAWDPYNQLNPGKICSPSGEAVPGVDAVPLRSERDRSVGGRWRARWGDALRCDGNRLCYSVHSHEVMCPSYRGTGRRVHSPQGRAALMRTWLLRLSQGALSESDRDTGPQKKLWLEACRWGLRLRWWWRSPSVQEDFSHEVYQAMQGCLACKACASMCPMKVDIPQLKSQFLSFYHTRYPRPLQDYLMAASEELLPWCAQYSLLRWIFNSSVRVWPLAWITRRVLGMRDIPVLQASLYNTLPSQYLWPQALDLPRSSWDTIKMQDPGPAVCVLGDVMSVYLEPEVTTDTLAVLAALGFRVGLAPFFSTGKSWHLGGFLDTYAQKASKARAWIEECYGGYPGVQVVGIDPAFTLTYRDEYHKLWPELASSALYQVQTLQEFLHRQRDAVLWQNIRLRESMKGYRLVLLEHCQERTGLSMGAEKWVQVFACLRIEVEVKRVGCCGMAGFWGHRCENYETSRRIFEIHWSPVLRRLQQETQQQGKKAVVLVSGGSCRKQLQRFMSQDLNHHIGIYHPMQFLAKMIGCSLHA